MGSNLTMPIVIARINIAPTAVKAFEIIMIFRQLLDFRGELLDLSLEFQDFFAKITIVHMNLLSRRLVAKL
jgi:hypothetical protein